MTSFASRPIIEAASGRGLMSFLALLPTLIVTTGATPLLPTTRVTRVM